MQTDRQEKKSARNRRKEKLSGRTMPDHAGMRVPTGDSRKKHDDKQR